MCYPTSGYIILSLRKLKFYGNMGPDMSTGGRGSDNWNTCINELSNTFPKKILNPFCKGNLFGNDMRLEKKDHHQFDKSKFFLVKFRTCFFTPFSNFNGEKIKVELQ